MDKKNSKRIGIFEYDWSIYHYIKDFAIQLAEAGYLIDIYLKDWDVRPNLANTNDFSLHGNIRFFNLTTKETRRQAIMRKCNKLLNKMAIAFALPRNRRPDQIIDRDILRRSKEIMGTSQYYCLIGVEKKGLIWAGILAEMYNWALVYFSLELYTEDNPALFTVYHIRDAERKYHKRAVATIIQDGPRADVLLKANGIGQTNILHFPVSAKGNIVRDKSSYLQKKLHIDTNKKVILYFGAIEKDRFISEIVKMARDLDDGLILVVHGLGPQGYIRYLQSIADNNKVMFSLGFVAENEILSVVSSGDIGIALYKTTNANDRLVAFSSSKVAYYTQCGIPMIAFDAESFRELVNCHKCAELINKINEIPFVARKILDNYDSYRDNAHAAYQRFYNVDHNCSRLIGELEGVMGGAKARGDKDV